jgi:UMF1 family MFS transporter
MQGHEARFFSLFSITDKSASFLGPAAIAYVTDSTGNMRNGWWIIMGLIASVGGVFWRGVDVERGRRDARVYAG